MTGVLSCMRPWLVHVAVAGADPRVLLLLLLFHDQGLGREQQRAIEAAFCTAERVTLAGSMIPALSRSTYSPVAALRPWFSATSRILLTATAPSSPALVAIQ